MITTVRERTFGPTAAAIREARVFAASSVVDAAPDRVVEEFTLLVSELASNAVLHAGTPFTVRVTVGADALRVEVRDHSPDAPRVRTAPTSSVDGRGLSIVDALAARWGVAPRPEGGGKSVWAELHR